MVEVVSLREQVLEHLRAMIVSGDTEPGQLYSVQQLAERFNVSRTPVREALLELTRSGLLRVERNRGFRVVEPTPEELDGYLELRIWLEGPAMEKVACMQPPPTEQFRIAREIYERLGKAADARDLVEFLRLDREFHLLLVGLGRNKRLSRIVGELRDHMRLPGLRRLADAGRLASSSEEHLRLLESLERGDARSARQITEQHAKRTRAEWA